MNEIDQAYALANSGRPSDGRAALERGAATGNADCMLELAVWLMEGRLIRRDLIGAREWFGRAGDAGSIVGRRVQIALLANGAGGKSRWSEAVDLLRATNSDPDAARQLDLLAAMDLNENGYPKHVDEGDRLSEEPAVWLFAKFLTSAECEYLIDASATIFNPSSVVDPGTGQLRPDPVRTSDSAAFPFVHESPLIHAINRRIAAASDTPVEVGEPLQVLRYRPGQEYKPHFDALPATDNQRVLTMLIYLNDDYAGGETCFLSTGLKVKGRPGDALLFRNADNAGVPDPRARHAGLPVISGEKLLASRWIRQRPLLSA